MEEGFDEFIHVPARLSILALLAPAEWVEFRFLRETIGTSDSALSKQITALQDAGYVTVRKERSGTARRTLIRLTDQGRTAFAAHAAALERIVAAARPRT
ncbi:transcriptional regulator [Actinoallomurus sp. NPDC052274]|uniref:transcriptional regulator n=1 Tax=Actinoallomurus sp. NPDC052274 TaxID=3155420 RepID=UPI0034470B52